MYSKVYYIVYGFFFSLIVAAVLCLCLTIMQGVAHIDPIFFLMSFAVAFVTSFLVTSIIPLARIAAACAVYFDDKPGTVAFRLLQNVFFSTLIMFFLGLVMTAFMTGVGPAEAKAAAKPEAVAEAEATAETMPRAPRCARPAWRLLRSPNPPRTALFVQNSQHRCEKVGE